MGGWMLRAYGRRAGPHVPRCLWPCRPFPPLGGAGGLGVDQTLLGNTPMLRAATRPLKWLRMLPRQPSPRCSATARLSFSEPMPLRALALQAGACGGAR